MSIARPTPHRLPSLSGKLRVLVVEDSLTVRKRLIEVLNGDPGIEVVGEAEDGRHAAQMCQALRPDVVTMDMMLPVMTGLEATEYIMAHCPTPILVVSSSTNRGEAVRTYEALAAGAVDVMEKPRGDASDDDWERRFLGQVKLVSRISVITHLRGRLRDPDGHGPSANRPPPGPQPRRPIAAVALGASTGGPGALVEVLRTLPPSFTTPVLVVVHISAPFVTAFADWLGGRIGRSVITVTDGTALGDVRGRVAMAPAEHHLVLRAGRLHLHDGPERHSCRPSVDVLFESVARDLGDACAAALLTGMGRDGASGLLAIRQAGGVTIAQDEATSVVWGMPREAIMLGAADRVLALAEIGPALVRAVEAVT